MPRAVVSTLVSRMEEALQASRTPQQETPKLPEAEECSAIGVLHGLIRPKSMTKEEYQVEKKKLQKKTAFPSQSDVSETSAGGSCVRGWDAGGKGGAIERLTQAMDRVVMKWFRQRQMMLKKAHHYLWRFWEKFPKSRTYGNL